MFQNYLKLLSFYCLDNKCGINFLANFTIKNLFYFKEKFVKGRPSFENKEASRKNLDDEVEEQYAEDYYSLQNYKSFNFDIIANNKI